MTSNREGSARRPRLLRITTALVSLDKLLDGQMRTLGEAGFEVLMVSADGPRRQTVIEREKCQHEVIDMQRGISPLRDLQSLWRLSVLIARWRPDIVYTQTPKAGLLGGLAGWMRRIPVRVHTWGGLRLEGTTGAARRLLLAMERLTARSTTHHLANSRHLRARLAQLDITQRAEVLGEGSTNGVDIKHFTPANEDLTVRRRWRDENGIPSSAVVFLFLGRLVADKGVQELAAAFDALAQQSPEAHLVLVGSEEEDLDPLPAETLRALNSNQQVHHLPWTEHVRSALVASDVLVHPSHREGIANVILQAGCLGLPVVCSDIEANLEALGNPEHAFLASVGDAKSLHDAMTQAMSLNVDRAFRLQQSIRQRYNRHQVQASLLQYLRSLMPASG